jgi:carbonic anhydrase/acetyltransferase-like protein (isoleucine patch superfamily)
MSNSPYITAFESHAPQIHPQAWVDVFARIIGRVTVGPQATVWPGAVIRADEAEIDVGARAAVLDLALLEAPAGKPVSIGEGALVSHQACVHGATIEAGAMVGIGAVVLDGAVVRQGAWVGAGAVVPPGAEIPARSLALGQPAKVVRELKDDEMNQVEGQIRDLIDKARRYREQTTQGFDPPRWGPPKQPAGF